MEDKHQKPSSCAARAAGKHVVTAIDNPDFTYPMVLCTSRMLPISNLAGDLIQFAEQNKKKYIANFLEPLKNLRK